MAEPKKETVRIAMPPRPEQASSAPSVAKRDAARIVLPSRTPVTPIRRLPPKITPPPSSESIAEAPSVLPRHPPVTPLASSASSPLLQPLPKPPGIATDLGAAIRPGPAAQVVTTPRPVAPVDAIPRSLAWGLLAVSALIFLIQIWNYIVS